MSQSQLKSHKGYGGLWALPIAVRRLAPVILLGLMGLMAASAPVWTQDAAGDTARDDAEFLGLLDTHQAGAAAPQISFLNGAGQPVTLASFAGKTLVVNFWATWCPPCVEEMPALNTLAQQAGAGVAVIAISTDFAPEAGQEWLAEFGLHALEPYFDGTGDAYFSSGATGLPYTVVIDPSGRIAAEVFGDAKWDTPAAIAYVRGL